MKLLDRPFRTLASLISLALLAAPAVLADTEPLNLSLREATARAIEHNLDIAVARLDPKSAEQGVVSAQSVFDPSLQAGAQYDKSKNEPQSAFSTLGRTTQSASVGIVDALQTGANWSATLGYGQSTQEFASQRFQQVGDPKTASLNLSITQPLLKNFGLSINRTGIDQAKINLHVSENQLMQRVMDTVERVENAYWALAGARRQLEVAQSSLKLADDFLGQTKIKVDVGTVPAIDITTAEAEVANRQEAVISGENAVRNAEDNLRALMRVDEKSDEWGRPITLTDEPVFSTLTVDLEQAINDAMSNRTEMRDAELAVRNQELTVRYRKNQTKPDLSLTGTYAPSGNNFDVGRFHLVPFDANGDGTISPGESVAQFDDLGAGEAFKELPKNNNYDWSVRADFKWPIGSRAARADLARAEISLEQQKLQLDAVKQNIRVEVRTAVRGLESSARRVESARSNVILQKKNLDAEQKKLENGLSYPFRVLQVQNDLESAQLREINAIIDYNNAIARLARAQGKILQMRNIELDKTAAKM